jgi:hypothetical protein
VIYQTYDDANKRTIDFSVGVGHLAITAEAQTIIEKLVT